MKRNQLYFYVSTFTIFQLLAQCAFLVRVQTVLTVQPQNEMSNFLNQVSNFLLFEMHDQHFTLVLLFAGRIYDF